MTKKIDLSFQSSRKQEKKEMLESQDLSQLTARWVVERSKCMGGTLRERLVKEL
jgi:hypothetical protein